MSTMPTIEQQHQIPTRTEQRKVAEVAYNKAQAESTAAKVVVQELEAKLQSEAEFRKRLEEQYDGACLAENQDGARAFKEELERAAFRARGVELKLAAANEELSKCRAAESKAGEQLNEALRLEAVEVEGVELAKMIQAGDDAYNAVVQASERLEAVLLAMQNKKWLDSAHQHQAADVLFKLTSRIKGFNY